MDNYILRIRLYNMFADLCQYIVSGRTKNYLVQYGCISIEEKERIASKIERGTPLKRGENGHFMPIRGDTIDEDFLTQVVAFSTMIKLREDNNCVMGFIQALDSVLSSVLKEEIENYQTEDFSVELNTNREETGIGLLPRCSCVWARKSRMSYSYRRIDNYLNNFMVIEDRVLEGIMDKHIYLKKGFFKGFDKTKQLKVAASPLTSRANFDIAFHQNDDFQVFSVNYKEETMEQDNALLWEKIKEAGSQGAEIIVFPEMLGNATMEAYIKIKLESLTQEERENIPAMIVLPSFLSKGQNSSAVFDKYGNRLAKQYKQNPYVMIRDHGEYMENILGYNMINIFHYEGIGRFAILICKDFLTTRYMERIMRGFMLTMIIVPSYSTGAYDFKMSFDLCAHDYCNVVWINSCAAMRPGKEMNFENIGYIRKRISRYTSESEALYEMKPCEGLLKGKCNKGCIYYGSLGAV